MFDPGPDRRRKVKICGIEESGLCPQISQGRPLGDIELLLRLDVLLDRRLVTGKIDVRENT